MAYLPELVDRLLLGKDPVLERAIAEAMIINETGFFRDSRPSNFCAPSCSRR